MAMFRDKYKRVVFLCVSDDIQSAERKLGNLVNTTFTRININIKLFSSQNIHQRLLHRQLARGRAGAGGRGGGGPGGGVAV